VNRSEPYAIRLVSEAENKLKSKWLAKPLLLPFDILHYQLWVVRLFPNQSVSLPSIVYQ
jgi:hypothetical protein